MKEKEIHVRSHVVLQTVHVSDGVSTLAKKSITFVYRRKTIVCISVGYDTFWGLRHVLVAFECIPME